MGVVPRHPDGTGTLSREKDINGMQFKGVETATKKGGGGGGGEVSVFGESTYDDHAFFSH